MVDPIDRSKISDGDKNISYYALLPFFLIVILAMIWAVGAIFWATLFFVNLMTAAIGGFVFVLLEGAFIFVDTTMQWIWDLIISYFTRDTWFNWFNNLLLFIILFVVSELQLIMRGKSIRESLNLSKLKSRIIGIVKSTEHESQSYENFWIPGEVINSNNVEKGMRVKIGDEFSPVQIISIVEHENKFEVYYKTSSGNLRSENFSETDEFEFVE